ncbi:cupin domain-containing protein [Streptomyces sp. TRM66268-LWL]|uniref:Cupin domain-containing protein n=1 Tax=Streptomyces polyasparticus TaxID=2767826 RepID=A0ABR7SRP9_9ACTN|nr:cupin domain-containing protein [Streptomyces polyasparticus]MBC9717325.1 cupin domain-containing protein [Streptomyces polyasparticus]
MPIIHASEAPTFDMPNATFTGLAAPSRGAKETCVWKTRVHPGAQPALHSFDHEEVLVAVSGAAVAVLDGVEHQVTAGDAIIVPAGTEFGLGNPHDEPFEAVVALPVGAMAFMNGQSLVPPPAK